MYNFENPYLDKYITEENTIAQVKNVTFENDNDEVLVEDDLEVIDKYCRMAMMEVGGDLCVFEDFEKWVRKNIGEEWRFSDASVEMLQGR